MIEIWKDIPNFEGLYQVSNFGNVRVLDRICNSAIKNNSKVLRKGCILKQYTKINRKEITLTLNNKRKYFKVHTLVAEAFLDKNQFKYWETENPNEIDTSKLEVNHKDENPFNNNVNNLEWCTHLYNCNYGTRNKRIYQSNPFKHLKVNLYDLNNNLLKTFDSVAEASRYRKCSSLTITRYCKGITKDKNYIWEYADK